MRSSDTLIKMFSENSLKVDLQLLDISKTNQEMYENIERLISLHYSKVVFSRMTALVFLCEFLIGYLVYTSFTVDVVDYASVAIYLLFGGVLFTIWHHNNANYWKQLYYIRKSMNQHLYHKVFSQVVKEALISYSVDQEQEELQETVKELMDMMLIDSANQIREIQAKHEGSLIE